MGSNARIQRVQRAGGSTNTRMWSQRTNTPTEVFNLNNNGELIPLYSTLSKECNELKVKLSNCEYRRQEQDKLLKKTIKMLEVIKQANSRTDNGKDNIENLRKVIWELHNKNNELRTEIREFVKQIRVDHGLEGVPREYNVRAGVRGTGSVRYTQQNLATGRSGNGLTAVPQNTQRSSGRVSDTTQHQQEASVSQRQRPTWTRGSDMALKQFPRSDGLATRRSGNGSKAVLSNTYIIARGTSGNGSTAVPTVSENHTPKLNRASGSAQNQQNQQGQLITYQQKEIIARGTSGNGSKALPSNTQRNAPPNAPPNPNPRVSYQPKPPSGTRRGLGFRRKR